jgi:hypothetical protein
MRNQVLTNTHQHLQAEEQGREVTSAEYCLKARKRLYLCHDLKAVACNSYEETPPDPSSKRKKGNFALSYMIKPIPNISRYPLCGLNFFSSSPQAIALPHLLSNIPPGYATNKTSTQDQLPHHTLCAAFLGYESSTQRPRARC